MKQEILKTNIPREKGWLYYCGTSEEGNITVCKSKMGRSKKTQDI